jgi:hypothetical protein
MNILKIIQKYYQNGDELYSPCFGEVILLNVSKSLIKVALKDDVEERSFYDDGCYTLGGECMLFPSKEQRDWNAWVNEQEQKKSVPTVKVGDYVADERVWGKVVDIEKDGDLIIEAKCLPGCGRYYAIPTLVKKLDYFDHKLLKPFDKVLVKKLGNGFYSKWRIAHFDSINPEGGYFIEGGVCVDFCVPFNKETEYIHGSLAAAPEFYR